MILHDEAQRRQPGQRWYRLLRDEAQMSPFARRVYRLRRARGFTARGLAKRAGISSSIISLLELGDRPQVSFKIATRLAEALGCSLDVLAGRAEEGQL